MKKKAVIIGAGPAGLTAAYELLRHGGWDVTVLESSSSVGGLCRCGRLDGSLCDLGGHRFFSDNERVNDLWKTLLGDKLLTKERRSSVLFKGKLFDYPVTEKIFSQLGAWLTLRSGLSLMGTVFFKHSEENLEGYLLNRFGRTLYEIFFKEYTRKLWGKPPSEISPDWGRQRIKGVSLKEAFKLTFKKSSEPPSSFFYPKLGPQQMWEAAAEKITEMGGTIIFESRVNRLIPKNGRICRAEYVSNGESHIIDGDVFLSSMPLKDLMLSIENIPNHIKEIADGLFYRSHITVGILCSRLKTKAADNCWIYVQDADVRLGRVQFYENWSPFLTAEKDKKWIGAEFFTDEKDEFFCLPDNAIIETAVHELIQTGIIFSADDVLKSCVERSEKAYPAYWGSYESIEQLQSYADSFGNLFCIGRNGQHRYNNISHAMLNALEAADNILWDREDKENVWRVNSEKSFQQNN